MENLKVRLREDLMTKKGKTRIEFLIYFEGKQHRISSGKSVEPKYWVAKAQCVDKRYERATEINNALSDIVLEYENYKRRKEVLKEEISLDEIKKILKGQNLEEESSNGKTDKYPTISEAIDAYIEYKELKNGTKNNFKITKNVLVDFCNSKYHKELTIDKIDFQFLEKLKKYLREERERPNQQNTIAKRLKILKAVLRYSIKLGNKIENP